MKAMVLLLMFLLSFLSVVSILFSFIVSDRRIKKRIDYYLKIEKHKNKRKNDKTNSKNTLDNNTLKKLNKIISEKLSHINNDDTEQMLISSGLEIDVEEYIMAKWILAAIMGGILYFILNNFIFLFVGGVLGYITPKFWVKGKIKKRIEKFNKELPNMINIIIGSLKSGYSFPQALKTVVEECDSPTKDEIGILMKEMSYGITMDDALQNLNKRMPSDDLELLIQAILIQRQVGGNLAGILEIIVETIRERIRIQRQVQTLTSQGRLSGRVIGALPVILGGMIYLMNPEYIKPLFSNNIGRILVGFSILSGVIGFILINKLTKIQV
ncbi:type II secretion system F family protein [Clostridium grantii]|uniref:Tight adherence protein B n=1 Tax=Clostridium grantii DSM 8605 TaxID=1121316 RepID=A0A1M5X778_9CLOT|nr:type II secretion system F family protein [Clostridium grantii]SHH95428.1 tight adherence protein B [Clostridium grantii DSM 8605]